MAAELQVEEGEGEAGEREGEGELRMELCFEGQSAAESSREESGRLLGAGPRVATLFQAPAGLEL